MSVFEINVLPFNIIKEQVEISFATSEKIGYNRIYKQNLPKNFPVEIKQAIEKFAWWNIENQEGDYTISVNLHENRRFAKHFFDKILFDHFRGLNVLTNRTFISDTEVLLEDVSIHNNEYKKYNRFSLRFDNNDLIEGTSLLVSYDGSLRWS